MILPNAIDDVILVLDFLRNIGFSLIIGHEKLEVKFSEAKRTPGVSRIPGKDRATIRNV